tara:strand:+ start:522 stop:791 length:270 start_codon:yes stop_codon:yes gene_type:complete
MSDLIHPNETDKLYYNDEISISEALKLWDTWEKSTDEEKKEIMYRYSEDKRVKGIEELKKTRKMSGWVTLFGWLALISLISSALIAVNL